MVFFITGGNDNGKSEYAEDLVIKLSPGGRSAGYTRIYLATMGARDEESLKRIKKHIFRRKDMEYITIEKSFDVGSIDITNIDIANGSVKNVNEDKGGKRILLIEDIPNLLAGEMFKGTSFYPDVADKITADIMKLISACEHTVIVTNEVFSDGMIYDEYTTTYLREFGTINRRLAGYSDKVVELVCGIPCIVKE
ncbi:bifunctional adenosylcobinamide kinase/adenosylcobinamide-phosphate guanylyltransferase [Butyrivibrio fibrisolvens]|uniref:Adenosylcobinamide kinase n=1 Tax=Butyrivibrio fibrisolvens TaxID=831 RepID=A0A1H9TJV0_BUTFI|nr:bifunctional adenosylcobinamide kinase/adenosylcobinamide-phosphate guanylyltransferase [Butyrivibrio fibrisolvens]MBQ1458716.1 bifunctional adenosylcobinamide kinase/adenosylcobinamide-phosphate guanylyltransferase [Butyrivibrio sp.]SER97422.1 adenosylcobinamide kinase /adenosylcobinamide-phosphate guanylyltransferase [Butyrivibrio fibrisolvens]